MAYGIQVLIGATEVITTSDDVVSFSLAPSYSDQIEPMVNAATPFRADRGNVSVALNLAVIRTHNTVAAAASYLMGVIADTPRTGDVQVTIDDGTTAHVFDMDASLIRVEPGPFAGATTTVSFTVIGPAPSEA